MKKRSIVFIGAGNITEALVRGFLQARLCAPAQLHVADIDRRRLRHFQRAWQVGGGPDNARAVADARIVILAVKPSVISPVLEELRAALPRRALVISVAAGVRTSLIEAGLAAGTRVIRVMPNAAVQVAGQGASALCRGRRATAADMRQAQRMFQALGVTVPLPEKDLDAVTAISGSGPAYVAYLVEAMLAAAQRLGLSRPVARKLVLATVAGTAQMLAATAMDPAVLRRRVTSPGGTTAAALAVLEKRQVHTALLHAIQAAHQRARALAL